MIDEKAVFSAAREIDEAVERERYLEDACRGEPEALRRIQDLLKIDEQAQSFLASPAVASLESHDGAPPLESAGSVIGPYRLLEQIGEGGCGVVFMAEQTQPIRRRVALKVIKPGMDTRQVIARFEAERQALALMDHPHIAKVLDAGATATGRPFFVMELVKGVPITEFCDANHLPPKDRLELFATVCHAVQHAHQKGIIHRDLKPSNVLVTLQDDRPVAKVIDFGIAKATSGQLTDKTLFTGFAQVVGTPLYMSPEQASMNALDVDTRSDVYSLGVLLYELLTGTTPFDRARLREAALDEIQRIIREEEPQKPSTRLSTADGLPTLAANRRMEPAKLTRLVRGDLDWIVMKALEKDRTRRYETANGLATDVQRYLADEAVLACPPSTLYRLRKLADRHRGAVVAASVVLLTLVGGVVGTSVGLVGAERARGREAARAEGEKRAKERAEANLTLATEAVQQYLTAVTDDPALTQTDFLALRKRLLESAVPFFQRIAEEKSDDPEVEFRRGGALDRLGTVRYGLGDSEASFHDHEAARAILARLHADDPDEARYRNALAAEERTLALRLQMLGRYEDAEMKVREGLALLEPRTAAPVADIAGRRVLASLLELQYSLLDWSGNAAEAEKPLRRWHEIQEQIFAESQEDLDRANLAHAHTSLGHFLLTSRFRLPEAEEAYRAALKIRKERAEAFPGDPQNAYESGQIYRRLGDLQEWQGKREEAEASHREAVAVFEGLTERFRTMTDYAVDLGDAYYGLGMLRHGSGHAQEALEMLGKAVARLQPVVAREARRVKARSVLSSALYGRAGALLDLEKYADGMQAAEESLAVLQGLAESGPDGTAASTREGLVAYRRGMAYGNFRLAEALDRLRRTREAEEAYRESLKWYEGLVTKSVGGPISRRGWALCHQELGRLLAMAQRYEEAEQEFRRALEIRTQLADDHPEIPDSVNARLHCQGQIGILLTYREKYEDAEPLLEEVVGAFRSLLDQRPGDRSIRYELAMHQHGRGLLFQRTGRLSAAESDYRAALNLHEQLVAEYSDGADHREQLLRVQDELQSVLHAQGKREELDAAVRASLPSREKFVASFPDSTRYLDALGRCYLALGFNRLESGPAEALGWIEKSIARLEPVVARGPGMPDALPYLDTAYWGRAEALRTLGRHDEALKSIQETLPRTESRFGPVHPRTLLGVESLARTLVALHSGAEAVALVDERVRRAAGEGADAEALKGLLVFRLRHFQAIGDAAGCRQTAQMVEGLNPTGAEGLYDAACFRAVTAAVFRASPDADAAENSGAESQRALRWLRRAVDAGYRDFAHMEADPDLAVLRDREDFRALLAASTRGR